MGGLLNLEEHFAFYGAYHSAPVNVLIHTLLVWPILFTGLLLLYFTPPFFQAPAPFGLPLVFNLGFPLTLVYAIFYVCLDRRAGSIAALLCVICWIGSSVLGSHLGPHRGLRVCIPPYAPFSSCFFLLPPIGRLSIVFLILRAFAPSSECSNWGPYE